MLDFTKKSVILVSVMRDIEKRKELKREWESIHPIDRPDWESFKRGIWKARKLHHIWPMADIVDRDRRAKEVSQSEKTPLLIEDFRIKKEQHEKRIQSRKRNLPD